MLLVVLRADNQKIGRSYCLQGVSGTFSKN